MNKFEQDILRLGPFCCLDLELHKDSYQIKELGELIDISNLQPGSMGQYEIDMARIVVTRTNDDSYLVNITRKPESILGYY